jgi:hypothetical protein
MYFSYIASFGLDKPCRVGIRKYAHCALIPPIFGFMEEAPVSYTVKSLPVVLGLLGMIHDENEENYSSSLA